MNPTWLSENPWNKNESISKKVSEIKDAVLNAEQREKFKDVVLTMEQVDKLKQWKLTIEELTKLQTEQLRKTMTYSPEPLRSALKKWKEDAIESLNKAEKKLEGIWAKVIDPKIAEKAKQKIEVVKDKAADVKDDLSKEWIMLSLEKIEKEWGILWFLVWILLWIMRIFWYKNQLSDAKAKVEWVMGDLSPEKIKEVKDKTKETIIAWLWGNLTPENQAKLDKALDSLTKEQLNSLYEKLQKWELTFGEIWKILPSFFKEIISPDQIEKTKKEIQTQLIETLKKEIKEKYNIDLDENKLAKLRELVEKNTTISNETIALFYEKLDKKEFKINDFYGPWFEAIINTSSLTIWLLINWIVPVSAFGMDFAKSWVDVLKISIDAMWIWSTINIDSFNDSIKWMSADQKAILIWLLYRKGGLFLNMIWSIWESISRLGIEFLTSTQVKWYQTLGASLSWNYGKQAELFGKITKTISPETYKDSDDILKKANDAFKKLEQNYKIIDIFQKSNWDINTATKLLKEAKIQIPVWIDTSDFNKFVNWFKPSMEHTFEWLSKWAVTSKLWFWASADLYELESKIQKVTQAQRRLLDWNFIVKSIAKLRELSDIWEISRMGDRMVLHFSSKEEAIKWISKWNILANKFPEIVKWSLDKLPIIAVAWIAANSDKPFFEEFSKEMKYLFPIVWPILLIWDSWLNWSEGKPKVTNWIEAWIWWALLAVDWIFLLKEISKSWAKWWLWYMIKPLKDIYSIWRWTAEWAYSIWKAALNWRSLSWALKESIEKSKAIKNSKLRAFAIIWLLWYVWYNYAFEDDSLKEIFWEDWKLDKEKLKKELPNLNDEEKTICFKYVLTEWINPDFIKDIDFKITNNTLYITSRNENIQESWFIDNWLLETLWLNPKIEFRYEKKPA